MPRLEDREEAEVCMVFDCVDCVSCTLLNKHIYGI